MRGRSLHRQPAMQGLKADQPLRSATIDAWPTTRTQRIRARGEEAVGELAQALLENPLFNSALSARARRRRARDVGAQRSAMGALNLASAADVERLEQRLRSLSGRLEALEDRIDDLADRARATHEAAVRRERERLERDAGLGRASAARARRRAPAATLEPATTRAAEPAAPVARRPTASSAAVSSRRRRRRRPIEPLRVRGSRRSRRRGRWPATSAGSRAGRPRPALPVSVGVAAAAARAARARLAPSSPIGDRGDDDRPAGGSARVERRRRCRP